MAIIITIKIIIIITISQSRPSGWDHGAGEIPWMDSKVYFESNTEEEEPEETTIEDINPCVAEAYQKKEMDEWSEEKIFDHQLQLWEDTADREFDAMMERTD